MTTCVDRRELLAALGGTALSGTALSWPLAARAQQPAMPIIGFLGAASANAYASRVSTFRQTLKEAGFVEGENVKIEYRWADNRSERLPALAAELVRAHSAVIVAAGGVQTALAAKAATATTPIVFQNGSDPVKLGLVASLSRPGGNITGNTILTVETAAKRLELIGELVPTASVIGWMLNPHNPNANTLARDVEHAGQSLGRRVVIAKLTSDVDLDAEFAALARQHAGALALSADPIFFSRRDRLVELAGRYALPTMFPYRDFVMAGGLISYGPKFAVVYRQIGDYVSRILKGEKAADLPVIQVTTYELVMNLKTAKTLGLEVPMSLLMRIDEVIE